MQIELKFITSSQRRLLLIFEEYQVLFCISAPCLKGNSFDYIIFTVYLIGNCLGNALQILNISHPLLLLNSQHSFIPILLFYYSSIQLVLEHL